MDYKALFKNKGIQKRTTNVNLQDILESKHQYKQAQNSKDINSALIGLRDSLKIDKNLIALKFWKEIFIRIWANIMKQ